MIAEACIKHDINHEIDNIFNKGSLIIYVKNQDILLCIFYEGYILG